MLVIPNENKFQNSRLSLEELRKIEGFNKVTNEEGETIIDDALALARMILELIV